MKVNNPRRVILAIVLGQTTYNDGQARLFIFLPNSTATGNDGDIVAPDQGNGRFHQLGTTTTV